MRKYDEVPKTWQKEAWEYLCDVAPSHDTFRAVELLTPFFIAKGYVYHTALDYTSACIIGWREASAGGLIRVTSSFYRFFGIEDDGRPKPPDPRRSKSKRV